MYSSENILWIKNIKRDKGDEWAYQDSTFDEPFLLNWSTRMKGSASTPKVGDIIVLFQKPNHVDDRKNYKVFFTHLVTPVSDEVIEDLKIPTHKWGRKVKLIAKPQILSGIPNPEYFNFFLPNRGFTNPIINLENNRGLTESETQEEIWRLFEHHFSPNLKREIFIPADPIGLFGEIEGDKIIREHIRQELTRRNSKIIQLTKAKAIEEGGGKVLCECCDFDFKEAYGILGEGFIECHHKTHISTGERVTKREDLALVCSNCHRMLHRKDYEGNYQTVESLRRIIKGMSD